ncbi:MAG: HAMP domain-containing histidine kinase [Bacteroidaceae bacterium]|nr:HAMP domain-containing histidine kinase [Bacteroidaceae bacterium]
MKRSVIWIICLIIGISFLALLYLESSYARAMIRMRGEHFDESVLRSLDQAAREIERNETYNYLKMVLDRRDKDAPYRIGIDSLSHFRMLSAQDTLSVVPGQQFNYVGKRGVQPLFRLTMPRSNRFAQVTASLQKQVQKAYDYERDILNEVIYAVMYTASEKSFSERLDPAKLEVSLRMALEQNGITLPFHFVVNTADGREVYRCQEFDEKGKEPNYTQPLYRSDALGQMGYVTIHFPARMHYIQGVARYVMPAMVFTVILFITFMVTVYLVVRQKNVSEMKNDFIHNMTHEFKTPISTISIAAQMMADKSLAKNEETYERLGGVINAETRRLRFQVEKVLQMSLFDHDNIALKLSELDANEVIDTVVQTFSLKVTQSGGSIDTRLEAEDPMIQADEMHFTNIIFNLMDNAVKYRRPDVELHLEVATWNQGDTLCISVQDNGIGIQKDDLKRIFDKFYRVHTGNQHDVKGFGLGLAYVKKMVTLHHGTIRATSDPGRGTRFTITIPTIN